MDDMSLVPTVCPYCAVGCGFYIQQGDKPKIVYMPEHPVNEGALCPKGNATLEIQNHPDRLLYPLKRTKDGWAKVSWEEALSLAAEGLKRALKEHGPDSLGFLGSAKCTNEENYLFQKMARLLGTNNVDTCARFCHAPTVSSLNRAFGIAAMTNPISDLAISDCIFVIGSNFAENHPIVARWVMKAKDRGAFVIVADPRKTPTAWLADLHLQIAPGSDVALLNGMIQEIVEEGLIDREFIIQRTEGFEELSSSLERCSPNMAAEITGVSASNIVKAARTYANSSSSALVYSMGITQHIVGTDNVTACANLALICGQVGRPGAGLFTLRGQNNVQGASDMSTLSEFHPGCRRVDDTEVMRIKKAAWDSKSHSAKPGLAATEMANAAVKGDLRALYIMGEDPANSDPNSTEVKRGLEKIDFLVVQDIFMTETAQFADLVLPATTWAEKEGTFTSTERRVQWINRAFDPPGEAKEDLWIILQLSRMLGLDFRYHDAEEVLAEISEVLPNYGGVTKDRLAKLGGLVWPCPDLSHPGTPILHEDLFGTSDGLGRIMPVDYKPPFEKVNQDYPLLLTTGRDVVHYNAGSMSRRSSSLMRLEPHLFVEINPVDAEVRGIEEGEWVEVTSARGKAEARAKLTCQVYPGVVFMPFHFPETNRLTTDALDPVAKIPEFKVAACQVRGG
ncbi:MAG: formate dehydrogenase subunit alpha [Methanotrichaceae archaeon]